MQFLFSWNWGNNSHLKGYLRIFVFDRYCVMWFVRRTKSSVSFSFHIFLIWMIQNKCIPLFWMSEFENFIVNEIRIQFQFCLIEMSRWSLSLLLVCVVLLQTIKPISVRLRLLQFLHSRHHFIHFVCARSSCTHSNNKIKTHKWEVWN